MSFPSSGGPSRRIMIVQHPFNSPVGHQLVSALDHELEVMYPDWPDLPHPGFQSDWVGGDSLADHRPVNPVPALDTAKRDELVFLVAFDVTDTNEREEQGEAVGCIGIKPMPFFPSHRSSSAPAVASAVADGQGRGGATYAELKRFYIQSSHRGETITVMSSNGDNKPEQQQRLATALVQTAIHHAVTNLNVTKLVLETGVRQKAAIKLYERLGWTKRTVYGDYMGAGTEDGGVSVCYEFDPIDEKI